MADPRPPDPTGSARASEEASSSRRSRFINPHRLFHGVWLPQWLEERPEVSEKAKKLYAYLTYFAGGKGCSWPSFGLLAEKLHCSRRHVMRLVQELSSASAHYRNKRQQSRARSLRKLLPLSLASLDAERARRELCSGSARKRTSRGFGGIAGQLPAAATPSDIRVTSPLVTSRSPAPGDMSVTSPGDIPVTPLVTPMSPKENNKKRTNYRGKVPVTSSSTGSSKASFAASPPPKALSDTTKIILERRIAELRTEIVAASKQGNHLKADRLHGELTAHQAALGFTPDDPPPKPKAPRKEESRDSTASSDWPSPEEVRKTFNELRRSLGWPIKDENL